MAWTTPRTWAVGDVVTAVMLNTHIRDNFNIVQPCWAQGHNSTQNQFSNSTWINYSVALVASYGVTMTGTRFTPGVQGTYLCGATVQMGTQQAVRLTSNGAEVYETGVNVANASSIYGMLRFNGTTDYLEWQVWCPDGISVAVTRNTASMARIAT